MFAADNQFDWRERPRPRVSTGDVRGTGRAGGSGTLREHSNRYVQQTCHELHLHQATLFKTRLH